MKVIENIRVPNSLCFSPDGRTAYFTDAGKMIVKCALDANNAVAQCDQGSIPAGLAPADLIRISDIRVDGSAIYLVTGPTDDARKVYQCPLDQQTGDLGACIDAGDVPGLVNSAIALR